MFFLDMSPQVLIIEKHSGTYLTLVFATSKPGNTDTHFIQS